MNTVEPRYTTTSLIRPPRYYDHFFWSQENANVFPNKSTPLIDHLVNTTNDHFLMSPAY